MSLFLPATVPAIDSNGAASGNSTWNFYYEGSLTPAATDLGTQVTADGDGVFADITLETDITYRAVLKNSAGQVVMDIGAAIDKFFAVATQSAQDANNAIIPGAMWKFYTTGTTTPAPVYADSATVTPLGYIVTANAAGRFPEIYLSASTTYKAVYCDAAGTVINTIDPVSYNNMLGYMDPTALLSVEPGAAWNGTAGTGFVTPPTDPSRTTAKPAMRLIVPPNQYFTDELLVGVIAGANYGGSLMDNMGLSKVRLYFESDVPTDINAPSFQTFNDANGVAVTYFGWWAKLKKPAATAGHGNVYFEAIAKDATMQRRVIGPYQFSPQTTLYDADLEVAPTPAEIAGTRYKTISAALTYIRTNSKQNTRITITEAAASGFHDITYTAAYQSNGYHRIEATVPVVIGKASYINDASNYMRPGVNGLHFVGSNITLDFAYMTQVYQEAGAGTRQHWVNGCNLINSLGRGALWRLGYRGSVASWLFLNGVCATECVFDGVLNACNATPPLVRGCSFVNLAADLTGNALCMVGNTVHEFDSSIDFAVDLPAFTLTYSGGEATATIELSGTNDASSRTYTARWGANSATFTVLYTDAAFTANTNYKFSHVVNWLNGLGVGFTATLLDDTRRATSGCKLATQGVAFTAQNVKGTTFTVYSMFDVHSDWYQQLSTSAVENVVVMDNQGWEIICQNLFITSTSGARDWIVVNNAFANKIPGSSAYNNTAFFTSQETGGTHSHVVVVHNTMTNQGWAITTTATPYDGYCLLANNTLRSISWGGTADPDVVIKDNHLHTGSTAPTYATGTTIGGDQTSLVTDFDTGDFTPAGALLTNLKAPLVKYDRAGVARGVTAPVGAVA